MKVNFLFILLPILAAQFGCATTDSPTITSSKFKFDNVAELKLGDFNQAEALKRFGIPDKKLDLPYAPTQEAWLYVIPPSHQTKLSMIFNKTTKILERKTWFVNGRDPEDNLEVAKAHFSNAHFESHNAKQTNPHFIPDEIIFKDKKLGVTLVYRDAVSEVDAISWTDPKLSSVAKVSE